MPHHFNSEPCHTLIAGRVLHSERLQLRLMKAEDAPDLFMMLVDPQVSGWLRFAEQPYTLTQAQDRCDRAELTAQSGKELIFAVQDKAGLLIGSLGLHHLSEAKQAEVGYFFALSAWGQGFAQESLARAIQFSRDELDLTGLVATTALDKTGSQRVLEQAGFARQREFVSLLPQGRVRPSYLYALAL
jgi:ribosomal-protein-alanine N-acetyltransferase